MGLTRKTERSSSTAGPSGGSGRRRLSLSVLIGGCICLAFHLISGWRASALSVESMSATSPFLVSGLSSEPAQQGGGDFSKFSHSTTSHQRLPCLLCHRRETNSPRPVRSLQHTPCAGCHAQQFAANSGPICTICHTSVEARSHEIKPFPSLKSFNMSFAHAKHRNVACSTCHKPINRGVALSMPSGVEAHTTCYQCHAPRAQAGGRDNSTCGTCHKPGPYSRSSTSAKAFRVGFGHEQHKREGLNCVECHKITGSTTRSGQVSSPLPTEHPESQRVQSCESCHNDQRAFGTANFANCKRCHQGPTFRF